MSRLGLVSLSALVLCACGGVVRQQSTFSPASTVAGETVSGGHASLDALRGHPVVLVFWASWCGPCHDEQPLINAEYQKWSAKGVAFLGVDMLDQQSAAQGFVSQERVPYQSVMDTDGNIAAGYLIPAAPALVVVNAAGTVVFRQLGGLEVITSAQLDAQIKPLLA